MLPINPKSSCTCWTENCCLLCCICREPAQEGGAVGTCWMAHGLSNNASASSRGFDDRRGSLARHLLEERFGTLYDFFRLSRRCMMDTVTWTAGQLKSERERPGSVWQQCRTRLVTASPNGGWIRRGRAGGLHPGGHLNRLLGCTPPRHQIRYSRTGSMNI